MEDVPKTNLSKKSKSHKPRSEKQLRADAVRREASKLMWTDPELRKRMTEARERTAADPKVMKLKSDATKNNWKDPEVRQRRIAGLKRAAANPVIKKRVSEGNKLAWDNPDRRKRMSETVTGNWKNPDVRKHRIEGIKKGLAHPDAKQRRSAASKDVWASRKQLIHNLIAEVDAAKQAVTEKQAELAAAEQKLSRTRFAPAESSAGRICRDLDASRPDFERLFATPGNVDALRKGVRNVDGLSKNQTEAARNAMRSKDPKRWPLIAVRYYVASTSGLSYDVVAKYDKPSNRASIL